MSVGDKKILTVTQLNMYVKSLLESSVYLREIELVGEISNFTNHYKSGHLYMSLKDEGGRISAVMFRSSAVKLSFAPENGMRVVCKGRVSLYERDGQYQFYITSMKKQGEGELAVKFEQLKEKLKNEGLFDADHKRMIKRIPQNIALITSPTGAAVQDILNILTRRFPIVNVIMCPVQVQGDLAAPQMIDAIERVNRLKCADTIIIGRGGGSIEDLWAFNDEALARAIYNSKIPVISAVGHEIDFTICDFVADLRAPTPSASAELAVPEKGEVLSLLSGAKSSLYKMLCNTFEKKSMQLAAIRNKACLANPLSMIDARKMALDSLDYKMQSAYSAKVASAKHDFAKTAARLETLSPMSVLKRGYSAVFMNDEAISSAANLKSGDEITLRFSDGEKVAVVK